MWQILSNFPQPEAGQNTHAGWFRRHKITRETVLEDIFAKRQPQNDMTIDDKLVNQVHTELLADYPVLKLFPEMSKLDRFRHTVDMIGKRCPVGSRIMDVGAWPGILTCGLRRLGWEVAVVDKDPERPIAPLGASGRPLFEFKNLCAREGVDLKRVDIEREPLPFEMASVDAILFTDVIEHLWHDPLFALAELNRVLKPGSGALFVSTPNLMSARNRINFFFGHPERVVEDPLAVFVKHRRLGHLGHLRLYAPSELTRLLDQLGFATDVSFSRLDDNMVQDGVSHDDLHARRTSERKPRWLRWRWFVRRPRDYGAAILESCVTMLEKRIPRLRSQILVVAWKIAEPQLD